MDWDWPSLLSQQPSCLLPSLAQGQGVLRRGRRRPIRTVGGSKLWALRVPMDFRGPQNRNWFGFSIGGLRGKMGWFLRAHEDLVWVLHGSRGLPWGHDPKGCQIFCMEVESMLPCKPTRNPTCPEEDSCKRRCISRWVTGVCEDLYEFISTKTHLRRPPFVYAYAY